MDTIYLASGVSNGIENGTTSFTYERIVKALSCVGWKLSFDWTKAPPAQSSGVRKARAVKETQAIAGSHVLGLVLPGGRGSHWECGVAYALGKPVVVLAENQDDLYSNGEMCMFYNLPDVYLTYSLDQFIQALSEIYTSY